MTTNHHDADHDVVIVGGGAAGLSAGIVLTRARANTLIIDDAKPRNSPAEHVRGFLSRDGIPPSDLLATGQEEFAFYGGRLTQGRVAGASRRGDGSFQLTLDSGAAVRTRAVLVATGVTDELPDIPGVRGRWGRTVHHCPHCHGYEVREQSVLVIGGAMPAMSVHQAALLRRQGTSVTLCTNGIEVDGDERARLDAYGVRIVDGHVRRLFGDGVELSGAELTDGRKLDCQAVFIGPRPCPKDAVLRMLGCDVESSTGLVRADTTGMTSVAGVWAAGNVINPRAQVITAAGMASAAAIAITGWLLEKDLDATVGGNGALGGGHR